MNHMNTTLKTLYFLLGFTSCLSACAEQPSADEVITTMEKLNGVTPGARRNHIPQFDHFTVGGKED